VELPQFRHNRKKRTLRERGLTDETARRALEKISLATTAVTRRVESEVGCALRVQVRDVVVVLARDRDWDGVGFIVTAFVTETAVQAAHRERVLEVAASVVETVTLSERLGMISEENC
jgi:hypothetical protein